MKSTYSARMKRGEQTVSQELLRALRGDRTQEDVSNALQISKSALAMYERGERVPRDEIKIKIAQFYGKSVQELFFDHAEHI